MREKLHLSFEMVAFQNFSYSAAFIEKISEIKSLGATLQSCMKQQEKQFHGIIFR